MKRYFSNTHMKFNNIRGKYIPVQPGTISPMRRIPSNIKAPDYYKTGAVPSYIGQVVVFNDKEIELEE